MSEQLQERKKQQSGILSINNLFEVHPPLFDIVKTLNPIYITANC